MEPARAGANGELIKGVAVAALFFWLQFGFFRAKV